VVLKLCYLCQEIRVQVNVFLINMPPSQMIWEVGENLSLGFRKCMGSMLLLQHCSLTAAWV